MRSLEQFQVGQVDRHPARSLEFAQGFDKLLSLFHPLLLRRHFFCGTCLGDLAGACAHKLPFNAVRHILQALLLELAHSHTGKIGASEVRRILVTARPLKKCGKPLPFFNHVLAREHDLALQGHERN